VYLFLKSKIGKMKRKIGKEKANFIKAYMLMPVLSHDSCLSDLLMQYS